MALATAPDALHPCATTSELAEDFSLKTLQAAEVELGRQAAKIAAADALLTAHARATPSCGGEPGPVEQAGLLTHWAAHLAAGGGGPPDPVASGVGQRRAGQRWVARRHTEFKLAGSVRLVGRADPAAADPPSRAAIALIGPVRPRQAATADCAAAARGRGLAGAPALTGTGALLLSQARAVLGARQEIEALSPEPADPWLCLPLQQLPGQWVVTRRVALGGGGAAGLEAGFCRVGALGLTIGPWRYGVGATIRAVDPTAPAGLRAPGLAAGLVLAAVGGAPVPDHLPWREVEAMLEAAGLVGDSLLRSPLSLTFVAPPVEPEPEPEPVLEPEPVPEAEILEEARPEDSVERPPVGLQPLAARLFAVMAAVGTLDLATEPYGAVVAVQRIARGWLARDRLLLSHGAVTYIQAIWRGAAARLLVHYHRAAEVIQAVVVMQAGVRMAAAFRAYFCARQAIVLAQAMARRRQAAAIVAGRRAERKRAELEQEERKRAAMEQEKRERVVLEQEVAALEQEIAVVEAAAATKIQATIRGRQARIRKQLRSVETRPTNSTPLALLPQRIAMVGPAAAAGAADGEPDLSEPTEPAVEPELEEPEPVPEPTSEPEMEPGKVAEAAETVSEAEQTEAAASPVQQGVSAVELSSAATRIQSLQCGKASQRTPDLSEKPKSATMQPRPFGCHKPKQDATTVVYRRLGRSDDLAPLAEPMMPPATPPTVPPKPSRAAAPPIAQKPAKPPPMPPLMPPPPRPSDPPPLSAEDSGAAEVNAADDEENEENDENDENEDSFGNSAEESMMSAELEVSTAGVDAFYTPIVGPQTPVQLAHVVASTPPRLLFCTPPVVAAVERNQEDEAAKTPPAARQAMAKRRFAFLRQATLGSPAGLARAVRRPSFPTAVLCWVGLSGYG